MRHRIWLTCIVIMTAVLFICSEGKPQTPTGEHSETMNFDFFGSNQDLVALFGGIKETTPKPETSVNDQSWDILINATISGITTPCGSFKAVQHLSLSDNVRISPQLLTEMGGMASLHNSSEDLSSKTHQCGGVLISKQYVLTAAHCMSNNNITIRAISLGREDLDKDSEPGEDTYQIEQVYIHPDYNRTIGQYNDIALLKIKGTVQYKETIWPVCLPTGNEIVNYNAYLQVAGWGYFDATSKSSNLESMFVRFFENEQCETLWNSHEPGKIEAANQILCAGRPGVNACKGYMGGPLNYLNVDGSSTLVGLVGSGIFLCSEHITPVLYTNVTTYIGWIYSTTGLPEPVLCSIECGARQQCSGINKCACVPGQRGPSCSESNCTPKCKKGTCNNLNQCSCNPSWGTERCNKEFSEAARDGDLDYITGELSKSTHVNGSLRLNKDYSNSTALHVATNNNHAPVVRALLDAGADPNVKTDIGLTNGEDQTPVYIAANKGLTEVLQILLEPKYRADVHLTNSEGRTPVHAASINGHIPALALLIAANGDLNTRTNTVHSPLSYASSRGKLEAVRALLTAGARIGDVDVNGWTALLIAVSAENGDVVQLLLDKGANINKQDNDGDTALHWAAVILGSRLMVRLLLDNGADKSLKNFAGRTPAVQARRDGNPSLARYIDNY